MRNQQTNEKFVLMSVIFVWWEENSSVNPVNSKKRITPKFIDWNVYIHGIAFSKLFSANISEIYILLGVHGMKMINS